MERCDRARVQWQILLLHTLGIMTVSAARAVAGVARRIGVTPGVKAAAVPTATVRARPRIFVRCNGKQDAPNLVMGFDAITCLAR